MKQLIKFELRKIFSRRLTALSLLAMVALSMLFTFSTYNNKYAFYGGEQAKGGAAVAMDKAIAARYAGELTDEKVQQMLADLVPPSDTINAAYIYLNATQSATAAHFADVHGDWNGRSVADVFGAAHINIGYVDGWLGVSGDMQRIFIALSFVLLVMLVPIFAGEYGGVDAILLATRHGRTTCAAAKVIAGLIAAVAVVVSIGGGCLLIAFVLYGSEGLDCSVLFAAQGSNYEVLGFDLTCRELLLRQCVLSLTSTITLTGLTLVLSAICHSTMGALALAAAIHALPTFLPIAESSPFFGLLMLSPIGQVQLVSLLGIGKNFMWSAVPLALVAIIAGGYLARRIFAAHEVS